MKSLTKFKGAILSIGQALTDCAITCYFSLANEDECEEIQEDRFCEECEWYNRRTLVNQRRRDGALELSYDIYREEIRRGLVKIQRESGRRKEDSGHSDRCASHLCRMPNICTRFHRPRIDESGVSIYPTNYTVAVSDIFLSIERAKDTAADAREPN